MSRESVRLAAPGDPASLDKVTVASSGVAYAVGGYATQVMDRNGVFHSRYSQLVARWDGRAWTSLRSTGIPADAQLRDVAVADVWVVGNRANEDGAPVEALAWRYTGTGWTSYRIDPHPGAILNGVHATSPSEVWAAGTPGTDGAGDGVLLTRWDGRRWKPAFRIPAVPALRGLADVTTAGGHVFSVGGTTRTLAIQN